MICPYCGRDSLIGPMPATAANAEMVCRACGSTFGAYEWFGTGRNPVRRTIAA